MILAGATGWGMQAFSGLRVWAEDAGMLLRPSKKAENPANGWCEQQFALIVPNEACCRAKCAHPTFEVAPWHQRSRIRETDFFWL